MKVGLKKQSAVDDLDQSESELDHEEKLYTRIRETNPSHPGYHAIRRVYETFTIQGTDGEHTCMVSELMREPLWIFRSHLVGRKLPLRLMKVYVGKLLEALDYLHSECQIIHTGMCLHRHPFVVTKKTARYQGR